MLLGAVALVAPPGASAAETGRTDPPGNNGTIKIEGADFQSLPPDNNPHQGCTFVVEFYNYDKGDYQAKVVFEDQNPTADAGLKVVSGDLTPFIGEDAAGGGRDLDARETYKLAFTGAPHPTQGYHVKLTIHAEGSIGADVKHKVFWVEGCKPATPPTKPPTQPTQPPSEPTKPPTQPPSEPTNPPTQPPSQPTQPPSQPAQPPTQPTEPTQPPSQPTTEPTEQPSAPAGSPTPTESESPTVGVPTAVDAGTGGSDGGGSVNQSDDGGRGGLGVILLAGGGLLVALASAVALRRRSLHSS